MSPKVMSPRVKTPELKGKISKLKRDRVETATWESPRDGRPICKRPVGKPFVLGIPRRKRQEGTSVVGPWDIDMNSAISQYELSAFVDQIKPEGRNSYEERVPPGKITKLLDSSSPQEELSKHVRFDSWGEELRKSESLRNNFQDALSRALIREEYNAPNQVEVVPIFRRGRLGIDFSTPKALPLLQPGRMVEGKSPQEYARHHEECRRSKYRGLPGWESMPKEILHAAAALCPNTKDQSIEVLDADGHTIYVIENCTVSLDDYIHVSTEMAFNFAVRNKKLPPLWWATAIEGSRHRMQGLSGAVSLPPGDAIRVPPENAICAPRTFPWTVHRQSEVTKEKLSATELRLPWGDPLEMSGDGYLRDLYEPRPLVDPYIRDPATYLTPEDMALRQSKPESRGLTVSEIIKSKTVTPEVKMIPAPTPSTAPVPTSTKKLPPSKGPSAKAPPAKGKGPPPGPGSGKPAFKPRGKGAKREVVVPKTTKQLFWDALDVSDADTFWTKKGSLDIGIDIGNVQEVFAKTAPKAVDSGAAKAVEKPKVISLLADSKRAYNMNISLSRFAKYSWLELRRAILELDAEVLTIDATDVLLKFAPQPDEVAVVTEFLKGGGQAALLDRPDQFVAAMIGVPLFAQRMEFHRFASGFSELLRSVAEPLEDFSRAVEEVLGSEKLRSLLLIILKIGNEINPKSATAFRFTTLNKLNDIRTTTKPVRTMLQYIGNIVYEQRPELLELVQELATVPKAAKIDMAGIDGGIAALNSGIGQAKDVVKLAESNPPLPDETDFIVSAATDFLGAAEKKLTEITSAVDETQANFLQLLLFFGENERTAAKVTPPEFFKSLGQFVTTLKAVEKERREKDARSKSKAKRSAPAVKKAGVVPKKKAAPEAREEESIRVVRDDMPLLKNTEIQKKGANEFLKDDEVPLFLRT
eukprot:Lankesteria_metandrocarpae@DN2147_c0_g1_i1.p1